MSTFQLKKISADGIPHAMDKAERYRLLNDPAQAESICQDVLAVAPDNQDALRCLILSLTDQFGASRAAHTAREARTYIVQLTDEYERAEQLRPPGNVDAVLRWNSCVRAIERERLEPEAREPELPLE